MTAILIMILISLIGILWVLESLVAEIRKLRALYMLTVERSQSNWHYMEGNREESTDSCTVASDAGGSGGTTGSSPPAGKGCGNSGVGSGV